MKKKKIVIVILIIFLVVFMGRKLLNFQVNNSRCPILQDNSCIVYYLLNIDGMKGLGHASFMLVNEQGEGCFYSYNGMQYNLAECLMGKAGIGKMKQFDLSATEVKEFLKTGDLLVSDVTECDNFDRTLYRYISREEYETIQEGADAYIKIGDEYEALYAEVHSTTGQAEAEIKMKEFLAQEDLLLYQIYQHNCDTVARELIALIDEEAAIFNVSKERLTPSGNYREMCKFFSANWGYRSLGSDTILEEILWGNTGSLKHLYIIDTDAFIQVQ